MNKRRIGTDKELIAKAFLEDNDIDIITMNYHFHNFGEIDIIGRDGEYIVFFEVKYRSGKECGDALEQVTISKQKKICQVCKGFLYENSISEASAIRFDVVAINGDRIEWVKNAFDYI